MQRSSAELKTSTIPLARPKNLAAIIAWCLFDWANSSYSAVISTFIFATYFTQKVAINEIIGTEQWAHANSIAGLTIALLAPILGSIADYRGQRKPWIGVFGLMAVIAAALLWFAVPVASMVMFVLIVYIVGMVCSEMALVFYNAMLADLVPVNYLGRISGWAWSMGYFGGIVSLTMALFLVKGDFTWLHLDRQQFEQVRICGPLVAIWLWVFMLPLFFMVPDHSSKSFTMPQAVNKGLHSLWQLLRSIRQHQQIFRFLLARMFYIDGLNTLFAFGGIYAAGTMHMSMERVIEFGIVMNVGAGIGAVLFAWMDDYLGSKLTILTTLGLMIVSSIALLCSYSLSWFWIFAVGIALCAGPIQSASRSFMVRIAEPEIMTELFGLFALSGKVTAFLGPWALGMATVFFQSQRAGMGTILIFLVVGGLLLLLTVAKDSK